VEPWLHRWLITASESRRPDDRLGVVVFDGEPTVRSMPSVAPQLHAGTIETFTPGTDLAAAIRLGMALFPADASNRLLLISDGNDTQATDGGLGGSAAAAADIRAAAREAKAAGVAIDVLP